MTAYLTLDELRQGLAQVLKHAAALAGSSAAAIYLEPLRELEKRLDGAAAAAAPPEATGVDLADTDRVHDGYAKALWHLTEACLVVPDLDDDTREAAQRVRDMLVPGADVWTASYPAEAQRAEDKKGSLGALADDLARLPVPGGDAREWASRHVQAGIKLGKELAAQAAEEARAQAKKPGDGALVRAQLIRLLGEFRSTLTTEAAHKPALAATATSAFALLDKLGAERASAGRAAAKRRTKGPAGATPEPSSTTPDA